MAKYVLSSGVCNMINAVSGYIETSAADGDYLTESNVTLASCSFTYRPNGKPYMQAICPEGNTASDGSYVVVDDGTNTHAISLVVDGSGISIDPPLSHPQPDNWLDFDAIKGGGIRVAVLSTDTDNEIANKVVAAINTAGGIPNTAAFIHNSADPTTVFFVNSGAASIEAIYRCDVDGTEDSGSFSAVVTHNGDGNGTQITNDVPTGLANDTSGPALKRVGNTIIVEPDADRDSYFYTASNFLMFTNDALARPFAKLNDTTGGIQEYSSPLMASSIVATLEAAAVEPTNVVLVGGKVVGEVEVDPTANDVKYNDAALPVGSLLRNTITGFKYLKSDTGVRDFVEIPDVVNPDWRLAAGANAAWAILQSM
jgi:hypothetical protein